MCLLIPFSGLEGGVLSEVPGEIRPEHPTPKLLTDNLDNFGNRADKHRLSLSSIA